MEEEHILIINIPGGGSISLRPFHVDDEINVEAIPIAGEHFSGWGGDLTDTANPLTLTIAGDIELTADFAEGEEIGLDLHLDKVGDGEVNITPTGPHASGDSVTLEAIPDPGWNFTGWSGDITGASNPVELTITDDMVVTANFVEVHVEVGFNLDVSTVGEGEVHKDPPGPYDSGDDVTLEATPAVGWVFAGWSLDSLGSITPVSLHILGDTAITATFTELTVPEEHEIHISYVGDGDVGFDPLGPYTLNETVRLEARPAPGWRFVDWSGNLGSTLNPVAFDVTGEMTITATFAQDEFTLTPSVENLGLIVLNPDKPAYTPGEIVQATAIPNSGWIFSHWNDNHWDTANPKTITMDADKSIKATFYVVVYDLTTGEAEGGTVAFIQAGPYHWGDLVTLTALPESGWSFSHWDGDPVDNDNPKTITINGDTLITPVFTHTAFGLITNVVGNGAIGLDHDGPFNEGDTVQVTAYPHAGWLFAGWSGTIESGDNPVTLLVDPDSEVIASFVDLEDVIANVVEVRLREFRPPAPGIDPIALNLLRSVLARLQETPSMGLSGSALIAEYRARWTAIIPELDEAADQEGNSPDVAHQIETVLAAVGRNNTWLSLQTGRIPGGAEDVADFDDFVSQNFAGALLSAKSQVTGMITRYE